MNDKTDVTHTKMNSSKMDDTMSNTYACTMHKNRTGVKGDACTLWDGLKRNEILLTNA